MPKHEKTEELSKSACSMCGSKKVAREDFDSEAAWKEFRFSRFCQKCQDDCIIERGV